MPQIANVWRAVEEEPWRIALENYWNQKSVRANYTLEREMDQLDRASVEKLDADGFYDFLLEKYFRWKYTAPNRYGSTTKSLRRYRDEDRMHELLAVKQALFSFDKQNTNEGLRVASRIYGLGTAGASGLLSVLFPQQFGTVDQFAVKALCQIEDLTEATEIRRMKPEELKIPDGVLLIDIMRIKSAANNRLFGTDFWAPRKIDMVLWTLGHND